MIFKMEATTNLMVYLQEAVPPLLESDPVDKCRPSRPGKMHLKVGSTLS